MGHRNVEIKARCSDLRRIRSLLRAEKVDFRGIDRQTDTYFVVPRGRLKLREGTIENNLVYYERDNEAGPKLSEVMLFPVEPHSTLKAILLKIFQVLVVVEKQREIYFIDHNKFHLDMVQGLGTFVEIEAIDIDGTIGTEALWTQCQRFVSLFKLPVHDFIAVSYSDLLLAQIENLRR